MREGSIASSHKAGDHALEKSVQVIFFDQLVAFLSCFSFLLLGLR
jgi:hypothetical protein